MSKLTEHQCLQVITGTLLGAIGTLQQMADPQDLDSAIIWLANNIEEVSRWARELLVKTGNIEQVVNEIRSRKS